MGESLPFENQILVDTFSEDCLFIFAKGLGQERTFLNHLKLYSDKKILVLVINANTQDQVYFADKLRQDESVDINPKLVTSDVSATDRASLYLDGGVQFVTSRILVVDLLTNRVPVSLVSGILVYRAHELLDSFQESFILRLYREQKKDGFVKAFSDSPTLIGRGLGQLQRIVRSLFVRRVVLVPRFELDVKQQLEERQPEVVEISVQQQPSMRKIQNSLMEIMTACTKDLKAANPGVDVGEEMRDDLLANALDGALERRLEESGATLSEKSQQLLADLGFLRSLIAQMEQLDPISFYRSLLAFKSSQQQNISRHSGWLLTSAAAKVFEEAKSRAEGAESPSKWSALKEVLTEVKDAQKDLKKELEFQQNPDLTGSVLLLVENIECGRQLGELVKMGEERLKTLLANKHLRKDDEPILLPEEAPWWSPDRVVLDWEKSMEKVTMESLRAEQKESLRKKKKLATNQTKLDQFCPKKRPLTQGGSKARRLEEEDLQLVVQATSGQRYQLLKCLEVVKPTFVLLYQVDLRVLRILEMHKAARNDLPLRVYLIMYTSSLEEQRYLQSLRKEKKAFELLIQEKGTLLVPREFETGRDPPPFSKTSSRNAGGQQNQLEIPKVIVDVREFRSELPLLIFKRGIDVAPVTLEVGDYVLSPEMCVERKSLSDLAGSLLSGRLCSQTEQMQRHYTRPILSVEGSRRRRNPGPFSGDLGPSSRDVRARLAVLLRHFPKLTLVWSPGPAATVEIFEDLKWNKEEPDVETAQMLRADEGGREAGDPTSRKMLLRLPGVGERMLPTLLMNGGSLYDLCHGRLASTSLASGLQKKISQFINKDWRKNK